MQDEIQKCKEKEKKLNEEIAKHRIATDKKEQQISSDLKIPLKFIEIAKEMPFKDLQFISFHLNHPFNLPNQIQYHPYKMMPMYRSIYYPYPNNIED